MPRLYKLRRNTIMVAAVALTIVFIMIISYTNIKIKNVPSEIDQGNRITTESTMMTGKTTLNPKIKGKLEKIKHYLGFSQLSEEITYPAQIIGKYVMLDPFLCRRGGVEQIDIVFIVYTSPVNLHRRQRIRKTFTNEALFLPFKVRVAFLLGKTENRKLEQELWLEHATYKDTVMGDFIDSYHNLTLKGVMGYRWVSQYCPNSTYVSKIDDDVIVNTFKLLYSFFNHMNGKRKSFFCNLWQKGSNPIRRIGKWKVESNVFAKHDTFPFNYCSGFVVIMTTDLIEPMFRAAMMTPFFWIEDVYMFGILPSVVGGVTYYNYGLHRNMTTDDHVAINCMKTKGPKCGIVASITTDDNVWGFWNIIKQIYVSGAWKVQRIIVH